MINHDFRVDLGQLDRLSRKLRYNIIKMSHRAETAHLGGALSVVDILVAVYWAA